MAFAVEYRPEVNEDLDEIAVNLQRRIKRAIEKRLETAPELYGGRLRKGLAGLWKIRVGSYRVVYEITGRTVTVWAVRPRRDVYPTVIKRRRRR